LDVPEPPEELMYIWEWWKEMLTNDRLTFSEIKAWSDLLLVQITPLEVEIVRRLDAIYWRNMNG
jgi:hypothetical protein